MVVLGIESTCDETGCAVVHEGKILSNKICSQVVLHEGYGGVVPELASREHARHLISLIDWALREAGKGLRELDAIAVAYGPGLIGSLLIGFNSAKMLAKALGKPFVCINHIEAHLFAAGMGREIAFPALGVVLSGGHTALVKMESYDRFEVVGQTLDDAIGESFDKVAKMMQLPYPGGPLIEKLALDGNPDAYDFKAGKVRNPFDFSFSGIKTKVLYSLYGQDGKVVEQKMHPQMQCDIAASFQRAVFSDVARKTKEAALKYGCKTLLFGGGVTNNKALRQLFDPRDAFFPAPDLTLDNGAMIAGLAEWKLLHSESNTYTFEKPSPRLL